MPKTSGIRAVLQPIMRLAFTIEKAADRALRARTGLTFSMFRMLVVLSKHPHANQRDIAAFWGVAEASVSRQIETLRRKKLISRVPNPANRRSHAFALTGAGRRTLARSASAIERGLDPAFGGITAAARDRLAAGLLELVGSFDAAGLGACAAPASRKVSSSHR